MINNQRGFTLLIAILLATIAVTLGLSLLDIAYKQVILASTAKQSQFGFYSADSAMECALYYDQQLNSFRFLSPPPGSTITCEGRTVTNYSTSQTGGNPRITTFSVPCAGSGVSAVVTVYKASNGATTLYSNGYNTCSATDPRRIERGLKVSY